MVQRTDQSEVRVEINVYVDGELSMSYGITDAWPVEYRSAVDRIKGAGREVYKQFRENF